MEEIDGKCTRFVFSEVRLSLRVSEMGEEEKRREEKRREEQSRAEQGRAEQKMLL